MLALPLCDLDWLKRRVANFAEDRPGVYRMLGPEGRVMYVGKAKRIRSRLLTYFRAEFPDDKAARILHATREIDWEYVSSEFGALLKELRLIQHHRPVFNVRMNRARPAVLIKVSGGAAPKVFVGSRPGARDVRHYGPFRSRGRITQAIRVLNDLLKLRDCALSMPVSYEAQGDLFGPSKRAGCLRYELSTCTGPCAGFVTEQDYRARVGTAIDFLEGRSIAPLDHVIREMVRASDAKEFELATRWRDRFDILEWLFRSTIQARAAIDALSFVYLDIGAHGDDRVYLIRRATVRAVAPVPRTPLERDAFRAEVLGHSDPESAEQPLPPHHIDEMLLLMSWFNNHPTAMRRTISIDEWLADDGQRAIDEAF